MTSVSEPTAASLAVMNAGLAAALTVAIVFMVIVVVGFAILFRRRGAAAGQGGGDHALTKRANILLVRVDDAVKNGADELGFAVAQFGEEQTREFATALADAKAQLTEAFALKQRLDDSQPDTQMQRHDWNARIIHLCEGAQRGLDEQERTFAELRAREKDAPTSLATVRKAIGATAARLPTSTATLESLKKSYSPAAIATVSDSIDRASTLLASARSAADAAESRLSSEAGLSSEVGPSSEAGPVAEVIRTAQQDVARAGQTLDGIDRLASTLAELSSRLENLTAAARDDLSEARRVRDAPPDPTTGAAVNEAMGRVEAVLATTDESAADPAAGIRQLETALASLDLALGTARNQAGRLEHARTALAGALLTARSQLSTTADYIDSRRGSVGADARSRLAEAQRLLSIAEAEADPVIALDTARSSATYSRDADALARYDLMRR